MRRIAFAALTLVLALASAGHAAATQVGGVTFDDRVTVGDETLVLNGAGLRTKLFIKVYAAALYLPAKQGDAGRILAADQPRRTVLHFLYDVDRQKMCDAWDEALAGNTPQASAELKKQFATLCTWMDDVESGERMVFTYVPGSGTTVQVAGETKGTLPGKDFADALWAAWIGAKPATKDLRAGLLGD
jgi:hypothetical protein